VDEGTRTPNPWYHNPSADNDLNNEKQGVDESPESWERTGERTQCQTKVNLDEWLELCPVDLPEEIRSMIEAVIRSLR
jgi:hypothetical protein